MEIPRLSAKEEAILKLLVSKPDGMYGLEFVVASKELKRGTVYVTLTRMAEKGYVTSELVDRGSEGGLPRRVFKVTGHGARVLDFHLRTKAAARDAFGGEEVLAT